MDTPSEITGFLSTVSPWKIGLKRIISNILLVKTDYEPLIQFARIWIDNGVDSVAYQDFRVETQEVIAIRSVRYVTLNELDSFFDELKNSPDHIFIGGQNFQLPFEGLIRRPTFVFQSLHAPRLAGALRFPFLSVSRGPTNQLSSLRSQLTDVQLYAADPPFRGLADLLNELGFSENEVQSGRSPTIEVMARAPITNTSDSRFYGQKLYVKVTVPRTLDHRLITFRTIVVRRNKPTERKAVLDGFKVTERDIDYLDISFSQSAESGLKAFVYVVYDGDHLAEFQIDHASNRRNFLVELHECQLGSLDLTKLIPSSTGRIRQGDSTKFESLVAFSFSMIGLKILSYAGIEFNDAPDILALTNENDLLVTEVTLGHPNNDGKLLKLSKRVSAIELYVRDNQLPIRKISGVIFSGLDSTKVDGARAEAANLGIALFCREELVRFLNSIPYDQIPDSVAIVSLIERKIRENNKAIVD